MSTAATPKQADVLDYIRQHLNETGYAPTYDEIGEYLGICRATVFGHIDALERKGLIQRTKNCARSIELPTHCPMCGRRNGK